MQETSQNLPTPNNKNSKFPPSIFALALLVALISAISVIVVHDKNQTIEDELTKLRFALNESTQQNAIYKTEMDYNKKLWELQNSHMAANLTKCKIQNKSASNMQQEVFDMKLEYLKLDKKMELCEVQLESNLREMQTLTALASTPQT